MNGKVSHGESPVERGLFDFVQMQGHGSNADSLPGFARRPAKNVFFLGAKKDWGIMLAGTFSQE
jgi:hypothetical protein